MATKKLSRATKPASQTSDETFRLLFHNHPAPMWVYDLRTLSFLEINDATLEKYGYSRAEFLEMTLKDVFRPEDISRLLAHVGAKHPALPLSGEWRQRLKDGSSVDVEITSHMLEFNGRQAALVFALDVSERKRAEHELRLKSDALENSLTACAIISLEGKFVYANHTYLEMWGYDQLDEIVGTSPAAYCVDPTIPDQITRAVEEHGQCIIEFMARRQNGSVFEAQMAVQKSVNSEGHATYICTAIDITTRKRAEAALRQSEERFAKAFRSSPAAMAIARLDGPILDANENFLSLLGYRREEVIGRTSFDLGLIQPEYRRQILETLKSRDGSLRDMELTFSTKSGEWRTALFSLERVDLEQIPCVLSILFDITKRKQAQQQLQKNEQVLRLFVEHSPAAIAMLDRDMRYIVASRRYLADYDLGEQDLSGRSHYEIFPEIPERWKEIHRRCLAGAIEKSDEDPFPRASGKIDWVRWEIHPWYESADQIGGIILFSELITERKEARAALQESEARLTGVIESAMDAIISVDAEQRIAMFNVAAEKMFGCTAAEALGQLLERFIPERFRQTHSEHIRTFGQTGVTNRAMGALRAIAGRRLNGEEFPVEASISQVETAGSKLYTVILRDVTERKRAEEKRRESERRYRALIENSHDLIQSVAPNGHLIFVNRAWLRALDYTDSDLPGLRVWDVIADDEQTHCQAVFARVLAGVAIDYVQTTFVSKNGRRVDVEGNITVQRVGGEVVATQSYFRDVTERKRVRERLRYQADLLQNVSDAIIASDLEFKITAWNRAAETIYGWMALEVIGKPTSQILRTEYMGTQREQVRQQFLDQGFWEGEVVQKHRDGSILYILASVSLVKDSDGKAVGSVAVNRDITAHKQAEEAHILLEEQLRQSQKMESIGRLAGGVAHDFNNLITVIQMYSDMMKNQMPADDPLLKRVQQIRLASERAATLTRQLLAFSRKQILAPVILDLNELVTNLHLMLERLIGEDIELSTALQPELWSITADPGQMEQVIMNLVVNARDAMPTGGMLTLETCNVHIDDSYAGTHLEAPTGRCVMLAVTDTGHGMDAQTRAQIFEPFFTTKAPGIGTGLGLATVYGIVKQSGGGILVYSEPGSGTTFKIYLPASATAANNTPVLPTSSVTHGGTETILLVEDEGMLRDLVRTVLQQGGYTVLEAHDVDEAISLCEQHQRRIDLLLTDVVMPRMSGRELAEHLKTLCPLMKVLFMSGYTDDTVVRHGVLTAEVEFLPKPFSPNLLQTKVREVLDK